MSNHRLLLLTLIIAYIFAPTLFNWMISPNGTWYRPFIIWLVIIVAAFSLQKYHKPS
jgi:uncharacterized membrane protein